MFKLGQTFWMRDEQSDYLCQIIGVKDCQFLNNKNNFIDFLLTKHRLSGYHKSFEKDSRITKETFRYNPRNKKLTYWHTQYWPVTVEEWRPVSKREIKLTKPKDLRIGQRA